MSITALTALVKGFDEIGNVLGRDVTLRQLHTLSLVVAAGDVGIDIQKLGEKSHSSPAAISRNVRVLGQHHYDRSKGDGMGLVDIALDPHDNRRRLVTATKAGKQLMEKALKAFRA